MMAAGTMRAATFEVKTRSAHEDAMIWQEQSVICELQPV